MVRPLGMAVPLLSAHSLLSQAQLHSRDSPILLIMGLNETLPVCCPLPQLLVSMVTDEPTGRPFPYKWQPSFPPAPPSREACCLSLPAGPQTQRRCHAGTRKISYHINHQCLSCCCWALLS